MIWRSIALAIGCAAMLCALLVLTGCTGEVQLSNGARGDETYKWGSPWRTGCCPAPVESPK